MTATIPFTCSWREVMAGRNRKTVTIGIRWPSEVQITSGLQAGQISLHRRWLCALKRPEGQSVAGPEWIFESGLLGNGIVMRASKVYLCHPEPANRRCSRVKSGICFSSTRDSDQAGNQGSSRRSQNGGTSSFHIPFGCAQGFGLLRAAAAHRIIARAANQHLRSPFAKELFEISA
jgi:hypothetical protein